MTVPDKYVSSLGALPFDGVAENDEFLIRDVTAPILKRFLVAEMRKLSPTAKMRYVGKEAAYGNIQDAIDASVSGETVVVLPGEYDEALTLRDGVNLYFYPGAVISNTTEGYNVITDNNVAVQVKIGGSGAFHQDTAGGVNYNANIGILIQNAGTHVTVVCDEVVNNNPATGANPIGVLAGQLDIICNRLVTHHNAGAYIVGGVANIVAHRIYSDGHQGLFVTGGAKVRAHADCISESVLDGNEGVFASDPGTDVEVWGRCSSIAGRAAHSANYAKLRIHGDLYDTAVGTGALAETTSDMEIWGDIYCNPTSGYGADASPDGARCQSAARLVINGSVTNLGAGFGVNCANANSFMEVRGSTYAAQNFAARCYDGEQNIIGSLTAVKNNYAGVGAWCGGAGKQSIRGNITAFYSALQCQDTASQHYFSGKAISTNYVPVYVSGGTVRLHACQLHAQVDSGGAHGVVIAGGTLILNGVSVFVTNAASNSLYAASAKTVLVYATSVSNRAKAANVTIGVGTFTVDGAVV